MKPLTTEWVNKAEGDFRVAKGQMVDEAPVYDAVCFHAQQCSEKYLEALLVERDQYFPKTHDLETLAKLLLPLCPDLGQHTDQLLFLTVFAVEIRYPGVQATPEDAERCLDAAQGARVVCRDLLGLKT